MFRIILLELNEPKNSTLADLYRVGTTAQIKSLFATETLIWGISTVGQLKED